MISVQQIAKSYGVETLFQDATFTIHKGERIGLVGRNGHGKTTLLRLLAGEETPDSGSITIPKGYCLGKISQHMRFEDGTLLDEACLGLRPEEHDERWKAEKILMGLGFSLEDFDRSVREFSGGFQMRLRLAQVLAGEPDLLLLDEPTNFLDIVSIRWLERFLSSWQGELILISHDRTFMDSVVTHVIGIHRKKVKKITGHTEQYYEQLALEEEVYDRERINAGKKQKQLKEYITKFRAKARHASLVQLRVKALGRMGPQQKLASIQTLSFSFPCADVPAKTILQADEIGFSYTAQRPLLFEELNFIVNKGDKICVIGKNGKGKTTLIKLLAADQELSKHVHELQVALDALYHEWETVHKSHEEMKKKYELLKQELS